MKKIYLSLIAIGLVGCATPQQTVNNKNPATQSCLGSTDLPPNLADSFIAVEDKKLLNDALGEPLKGKLCQGKVYASTQDSKVTLYRAWNSTNPKSQYGEWWAIQKPKGKVADYRSEFEICYQWSPLDKLVQCTLKPGTKVVVGTGQSAKCSQYLKYDVSDKLQIYLENAKPSTMDCKFYDGEFSWKQKP